MAIDNVRLPVDIERGAKGGPGFLTSVVTLENGGEQRNAEWSIARGSWDIGYGVRGREDIEAVLAFFYGRRGRHRGFLFKDWLDFSATAEPVGAGTSSTTRQLIKTYPDSVSAYIREIFYPIESTLIVYVDNIYTTDYTLDEGGVLTFLSDPGGNVKATFEFDVAARFDIDTLPVTLATFMAGEISSIPIVELRP
jgi:uncharacterized protein (TIGR02217 family)